MNEHDDQNPQPAGGQPAPDLSTRDTQPVTLSGATVAYPTLPAAYTLDDDSPAPGDASSGGPADPATAATGEGPRRMRRPLRVRTVVFGLVMLAISVISLVALLTDVRIDGGVAGLGLLIGAGAALLAGGIAAAAREARGGPGAVR